MPSFRSSVSPPQAMAAPVAADLVAGVLAVAADLVAGEPAGDNSSPADFFFLPL